MTEHPENSFLPLSARDFHILFVLAGGDSHGYGLVKTIEAQTDGLIRLDPANLYRAIQRMVDSGLVEDTEPPISSSSAPRTPASAPHARDSCRGPWKAER